MLILLLIVFVTNDRNCNKHAADAVYSSCHFSVIAAEVVPTVVDAVQPLSLTTATLLWASSIACRDAWLSLAISASSWGAWVAYATFY